MRITPLDVRKQEFRKVVRGLDADEVYAFLATVADEYEIVLTDNKQLREKVIDLDEKVVEYRNMERTLRDTLLTAERVMSEARQNAKKEADLIIRDAKMNADQETSSISQQVETLKAQLRELKGQRESFLARMKGLSEAQMGLVESYHRDFQSDDAKLDLNPKRSGATSQPARSAAPTAAQALQADEDAQVERAVANIQENPTREISPAVPSAPVSPIRGSTPHAAANDQWRNYAVGAGMSGPRTPAAPRNDEHDGEELNQLMEAVYNAEPGAAPAASSGIHETAAPASGQPAPPVAASPQDDFSGAVDPLPPISVESSPPSAEDARAKASFNGWSMQRFTEGAGEETKTS
jgi:cell division initiation protein